LSDTFNYLCELHQYEEVKEDKNINDGTLITDISQANLVTSTKKGKRKKLPLQTYHMI
jgi:hypothetical protein